MDITVAELKERLDKGEDLNFFDVREEHEFEEDNLGAILIPLGELPEHLDELEELKDEEIIIPLGCQKWQGKEFSRSTRVFERKKCFRRDSCIQRAGRLIIL